MSMVGGSADIQVYQSETGDVPRMNVTTAAGTNGATIRSREGDALITSAGSDTIYAGTGNTTVIVEAAATVYAGSGVLSVFGRSDTAGAVVYADGGTVTLDGDTGDITYYGGAGANTVNDLLSNDRLIGGSGRMTVIGGSRETIIGGAGGLIYTSADGGGANVITTAAGSANTIDLAQSDTVFSYGKDTIQGGGGNSSFTLNGNAVLYGSTGNSQVVINGTATLYGHGQDWVTVNAGAKATIVAEGQGEYVSETGAVVSLSAGTGAAAAQVTVSGGEAALSASETGPVTVSTQSGVSTTVKAGAGVVDVASGGADLIYAGVGADVITIYGANRTCLERIRRADHRERRRLSRRRWGDGAWRRGSAGLQRWWFRRVDVHRRLRVRRHQRRRQQAVCDRWSWRADGERRKRNDLRRRDEPQGGRVDRSLAARRHHRVWRWHHDGQ